MSRKTRRRFTPEFKVRVVTEVLRGRESVQAIARRYELHPNLVSNWKRQAVAGLEEGFGGGSRRGPATDGEAEIRKLEARVDQLTVERDFFRRVLERAGKLRESEGSGGEDR